MSCTARALLDVDDRRRHKTYLIALIDDATRMIPAVAFARNETVAAFLPVFERAIQRRFTENYIRLPSTECTMRCRGARAR
jgi:hypothetical protein